MAIRLQIRRDTEANWIEANPVLSQGELIEVLPSDNGPIKFKIGDGIHTWTELDYVYDSDLIEKAVKYNGSTTVGSATQGVYVAADGTVTIMTYELNKTVPADAVFTDTTYSDFTGADGSTAGTAGLVPAPSANDDEKYLRGDGTWSSVDTFPDQTSQSGKFLTTNGTTVSWANIPEEIPAQTGNSGKFLTTNGTTVSWASVDAFPDQTSHAGEFLTTNGTTVSWASVDALPSQTGQSGKFLTTDGTDASWATITIPTKISDLTDDTATYPIDKADTLTNLTATVTELNYVDGVTSNIQTQFNNITDLIPSEATSSNQLADKDFVNSSISTETANFIGTFENETALEVYAGTVTNNDYAFVRNSLVTDSGNDWADFASLDAYSKTHLTNFDYAWVVNGTAFDLYRFDIVEQEWVSRATAIAKDSVTLNAAYNRYKAVVASSTVTWNYEYTLNNSSFTAQQWASINSGITSGAVTQITTNQNAIGALSSLDTTVKTDLVSAINEVNTTASGKVSDVQLNSTSVVTNGVANVPKASANDYGVIKIGTGLQIQSNGQVYLVKATDAAIIAKTNNVNPIVPDTLDVAIREGLGNNSLTWTEQYKTNARTTIGAIGDVQVNGTSVVTNGVANVPDTVVFRDWD